jgi:hypothetical protein
VYNEEEKPQNLHLYALYICQFPVHSFAQEMFIVRHGQMELLLEDSMQNNADADISSGDRSISPTLNKFYSINETNR